MTTRRWDEEKLESLIEEMVASIDEGLREEHRLGTPEDRSSARVEGFWFLRLLECQDGPRPEIKGKGKDLRDCNYKVVRRMFARDGE